MNISDVIHDSDWVKSYMSSTFINATSYNIHNEKATIFKDSKIPVFFEETKQAYSLNKAKNGLTLEAFPDDIIIEKHESLGQYILIRKTDDNEGMREACQNVSMNKYGPDGILDEGAVVELRINGELIYGIIIFETEELKENICAVYNNMAYVNNSAVPCFLNDKVFGFAYFRNYTIGFARNNKPFVGKDNISLHGYFDNSTPAVKIVKGLQTIGIVKYKFEFDDDIPDSEMEEAYKESFAEAMRGQYKNYIVLKNLKSLRDDEFLYCTKSITAGMPQSIWNALSVKNGVPQTRTLYEGELIDEDSAIRLFGSLFCTAFILNQPGQENHIKSAIFVNKSDTEEIAIVYPTEESQDEFFAPYFDVSEVYDICTEQINFLIDAANRLNIKPGIPEKLKNAVKNF